MGNVRAVSTTDGWGGDAVEMVKTKLGKMLGKWFS